MISRDFLSFLCWFQWIVLIFLLNRKSFFRFFNWFWEKLWFLGWFQKNFSVFLLIFKELLGFFVPFRENFWCLGASFRSFENDMVAPFKTIRLHLNETNIFYSSSDDEYGGPCHRESCCSSAPAYTYIYRRRIAWEK